MPSVIVILIGARVLIRFIYTNTAMGMDMDKTIPTERMIVQRPNALTAIRSMLGP